MRSRQDVQKRRVWAERLRRHRSSGLTVARFCASEGVSVHTFFYWSKRIAAGSSSRSDATDRRREPAGHSYLAAGTAPPALVRFHFNTAVEVSVPADCLDAIRCLASCLQNSRDDRCETFQEVVVATR
jgi:hypothetical protein